MAVPDERYSAFAEYVAARSLWLRRVAFLLCHDLDRADDLVQASITKLYVHWSRVHGIENLDGYVRTILVNTYLAEQRSHWWKRVTLGHEPAADEAAATVPNPDLKLDLAAALASITPRQRAVLVLRFYCDLPVEEAARLLGCSTGTVKSQTSRGLAAMRRLLASPDAPFHAETGERHPARGRRRAARTVPAPSVSETAFPEGS